MKTLDADAPLWAQLPTAADVQRRLTHTEAQSRTLRDIWPHEASRPAEVEARLRDARRDIITLRGLLRIAQHADSWRRWDARRQEVANA